MKLIGNLILNAAGASEVQNFIVERLASLPSVSASEKGRIVFNTTDAVYYFNTGTVWSAFATGGNAAALQTEVDALETALGDIVSTSGVFSPLALTTLNSTVWATDPTSLTNALGTLANYVSGKDTLAELGDVNLTGVVAGDFLRYDGGSSTWVDHTLVLADVTDVTATAAEVNTLHGITASTAELNILHGATLTTAELNVLHGISAGLTAAELSYVDGVTSGIQGQLDNKQPLDAGLTALSVFNTNGIIVQTADNTWAGRTTVAPAAGITITNPAGLAGDITFALANDLAAVEGLASNGFSVRTGDGTWTIRDLATASINRITIDNGNGVLGSPTMDLATVTDSGTGTFLKLAKDTYGRVTGTTAVTLSDITTLADTTYVNATGDTMTGNLIFTSGTVTGIPSPTAATEAANKAYVDALVTGLTWKNAVAAASTANIDLTTGGPLTIDTISVVAGQRVLVKNQTLPEENGIYIVNTGAWTRALDMDAAGEFTNATVFVQDGSAHVNTAWVQTDVITTVGTDPVSFVQFNGASGIVAGIGLASSGNTISINMGAGIVQLPTDEVGIDLYSNQALQLTVDGTTPDGTTNAKLALFLASGSGLSQTSSGLTISANGVTNDMIANEAITLDVDGVGTGSVALGGTLTILGTATQGLHTSIVGDIITLTADDAAYVQKGVASFDTNDFTVTAGAVSIKSAGIDNAQLANPSITVTGTTGSDDVALGESFAIVGAAGTAITTASATNSVTISVADATDSIKGLASFNSAFFSVTAGAVDLAATLDDLTNVSSADAATTNDVLTKTATDWQPITRATLLGTESINSLSDVVLTSPSDGEVLTNNGTNWVNQKIYYVSTQASSTTWSVVHGIGQKFVTVTIYDNTDNVIIPQSIVATDANTTTITFNTAVAGTAVVMGVA